MKHNFYYYMRVSTKKQDIARQTQALEDWQKQNNIFIAKENILTDYYTGKTFDRVNYQRIKQRLKNGDYLIIKEIDRLGRDWDGIKKEWEELKEKNINIIVLDIPLLSDPLPSQSSYIQGLDFKLIREQVFSLMCYIAQKEREKISQRTKEALAEKKLNGTKTGRPIGHPRSEKANKENFIKTLEKMINEGIGQDKACLKTGFPTDTFKRDLKKCYNRFNTKDYKTILKKVKKVD